MTGSQLQLSWPDFLEVCVNLAERGLPQVVSFLKRWIGVYKPIGIPHFRPTPKSSGQILDMLANSFLQICLALLGVIVPRVFFFIDIIISNCFEGQWLLNYLFFLFLEDRTISKMDDFTIEIPCLPEVDFYGGWWKQNPLLLFFPLHVQTQTHTKAVSGKGSGKTEPPLSVRQFYRQSPGSLANGMDDKCSRDTISVN